MVASFAASEGKDVGDFTRHNWNNLSLHPILSRWEHPHFIRSFLRFKLPDINEDGRSLVGVNETVKVAARSFNLHVANFAPPVVRFYHNGQFEKSDNDDDIRHMLHRDSVVSIHFIIHISTDDQKMYVTYRPVDFVVLSQARGSPLVRVLLFYCFVRHTT